MKIEVNQGEAKWRGSPLASTIVFFRDCNREKKIKSGNCSIQYIAYHHKKERRERS